MEGDEMGRGEVGTKVLLVGENGDVSIRRGVGTQEWG